MNDTQKMLQTIINGQSTFRQDVLGRIDKLDTKLGGRINGLEDRIGQVEKNLTSRIDKLGTQLAYLEDDAPTREEFDNLEQRVDKIAHQPTSTL